MRRNLLFALFALTLSGCGGAETTAPSGPGTTTHPGAPPLPGETECSVVERTGIEVPSAQHVPTCTDVTYATNPPSGGDHWPVWAAFKRYDKPVPREMYVHDLEHGVVALLYRCAGSCPDVEQALQRVLDGATDSCPKPRVLMTPDPDLETPIAAAAWGATYTATCIDEASLAGFVKENIAKGPEDVCAEGADVSTSSPCPAGGS